jgi:hypothetical protein
MGLIDRLKGLFGGGDGAAEPPAEIPIDVETRRTQLDQLESALQALARAMAADESRMVNPGWSGRVEDLRFAAHEAGKLKRGDFDRAALQDLAAEVRPLYGGGPVPDEYAPFRAEHDRVLAAVSALRSSLPSES